MSRFAITTPIFYVNAPPHIGHAYTVVAADVLARFHRQRGDDVRFLTGTDEHGAKIAEAAAAAGKTPQALVDEVSETFRGAWDVLDVHPSDFLRTTEPRHEAGVAAALTELRARGLLYEQSYRGRYCTGCEKFVTEKDLDGAGKCPLHNRVPTEVEERNWFFRLSGFLDPVRLKIESGELRIAPDERANEVRGLFAQGLDDFSVSRSRERVPWGVSLPFDTTQTVYVWVDALLNYVTALGYGNAKREAQSVKLTTYWPADLQLIGQDILKFHAVYWPALLLALGLDLPREIFVHGFFTVGGQKISKSLGNAIDPLALVRRYGSDAARFLLLSQFPFGASGDVQAARFDEQYDAILANTIGNLVSRTVTLLQKFSDSRIPNAPPDNTVIASDVKQSLSSKRNLSSTAIGERGPVGSVIASPAARGGAISSVAADLDDLVNVPVRLAQALNQYADRAAPWKETDAAKRAVALRTLADGIVSLAMLAEPLVPRTAASIQEAFGVVNRQHPAPDTVVSPTVPPILFPRV